MDSHVAKLLQRKMNKLYKSVDLFEFAEELLQPIKSLLSDCIQFFGNDFQEDLVPTYYEKIDFLLDYLHDHLNTGYWCQVPDYIRITYTQTNILKVIVIRYYFLDRGPTLIEDTPPRTGNTVK